MSLAEQQITPRGYERLRAELRHLTTTQRADATRELRDAREDGAEPGENAGLMDALHQRAQLERRIAELEHGLLGARIAEPPPDGVAGIGAHVRLRLAGGGTVVYQLVGELEADAAQGRLSVASPVGQALLARSTGDVVEVETPTGTRRFAILAVASLAQARAA